MLSENETERLQDRMRRLLVLNTRLNELEKEFSELRNECTENENLTDDFNESDKTIARLKNETFDRYRNINNKLNSKKGELK